METSSFEQAESSCESMTGLYSFLLSEVFGGFLRREPELLRAVEAFKGKLWIEDDALNFTVPGLFEFSLGLYEADLDQSLGAGRESYLRFRKSLYANPTNQLLKVQGGLVEVVSAGASHDDSIYRLIRCPDSRDPVRE